MMNIVKSYGSGIYTLLVVFFLLAVLTGTHFYFKKLTEKNPHTRIISQIVMTIEIFLCLFLTIVLLPVKDPLKGQILGILGVLLSGALALSSTTLLGNILAGIMIRSLGSLKMGDFIEIEDFFGRVSEKGLFHIEIQTEDRNLVTIFNMFLVSKPIKVVYPSGTVISSEVSLGYDVSPEIVKPLLMEAAENSGLENPFVYIVELGDFSILYRISGILSEVKYLISGKYHLNDEVIKVLHRNSVEIVSPNFMNTRTVNDKEFIPEDYIRVKELHREQAPEDKIFEKADKAEKLEENIEQLKEVSVEIEEAKKEASSVSEGKERSDIEDKLEVLKKKEVMLNIEIEKKKGDLDSEEK